MVAASEKSVAHTVATTEDGGEDGAEREEEEEEQNLEASGVSSEPGKPFSARASAGKRAVRREEVWREIVKSSNGRDKALVCAHPSTFPHYYSF